jgi:hypothetical protein
MTSPDTIISLAAAAVLAAVVVLVAAMRRPPQMAVQVRNGALCVRFEGWDALWTLRRPVTIPVEQVVGVAVAPLSQVAHHGWRRRGTWIPRVIRAGSFGRGDRRDLWDVRTPAQVLWVELRPGSPYRRIILQVPDPQATAADLRPSVGSFTPTDLADQARGTTRTQASA